MRRIVARGGKPSLIDIDAPACASGRVLVKTEFSTVSAGTESSVIARSAVPDAIDVEYPGEPPYERPPIRHWMRNSPEPTPPLPGSFSLGYSLDGRVIEVGSDVDDIAVGAPGLKPRRSRCSSSLAGSRMGAGSLKSVTGTSRSAACMKRCHARAGHEPPVRLTPLMV